MYASYGLTNCVLSLLPYEHSSSIVIRIMLDYIGKCIVSAMISCNFLHNCLFLIGVAVYNRKWDDAVFVGPLGSPCYIVNRLSLMYLDLVFSKEFIFFLIDDLVPADISSTVSESAGEVSC